MIQRRDFWLWGCLPTGLAVLFGWAVGVQDWFVACGACFGLAFMTWRYLQQPLVRAAMARRRDSRLIVNSDPRTTHERRVDLLTEGIKRFYLQQPEGTTYSERVLAEHLVTLLEQANRV